MRRRLVFGSAVLALVLYTVVLALNVGAVAGGADQSGYMNHARLLASGHLHVRSRVIGGLSQSYAPPYLYVPLGFVAAWNGDGLAPSYPAGLPILILLLKTIVGWRHAADLTMILHSLAGLVATYALGRVLGLGRAWAAVGAAMVAASPLYLYMSLQTMSDVPSLSWTTATVLAALKSRKSASWALAAGGAIAMDVLLRPTNVLAFIPVGIALGASTRRWILFILGGLPGALFFCAHSAAAYGRLLTTGYDDTSHLFSATFVPETLLHYALWLPVLFSPGVALGFGLPLLEGETARTRWLLGTWIVVFAAFYSGYQYTHESWWYLRFLLPAVPAMIVAAMLVCRAIVSRISGENRPGRAIFSFAVALALVVANSLCWSRDLDPLGIGKGELKYQLVCDWMTKNLPKNAVCAAMEATGAIFYYTNFTFVRYDMLNEENVSKVEAAVRSSGRPLYAILFPYEILERHVLEKRMPGHWIQIGNVDDVTIWRREFDTTHLILEEPSTWTGIVVEGPGELRTNRESGGLVKAVYGPLNWWLPEKSEADYWRWSKGDSSIVIHNPQPFAIMADMSFGLATVDSRAVTLTVNGTIAWHGMLKSAFDNRATLVGIELPPGDTVLFLQSDRPAVYLDGVDRRPFAFSVRNLKISLKGRWPPK